MSQITIGNVIIQRGIEHTSQYWIERINQKSQRSVTGEFFTFDNSRSILRGLIEIRYITYNEAVALRDFITNTIRFGRFNFDIIPDSFVDLGLGEGVTIPSARYDGDLSTESIIKPIGKANKFNVSFPYYYAIPATSGLPDHEGVIG